MQASPCSSVSLTQHLEFVLFFTMQRYIHTSVFLLFSALASVYGQRITTIQLDGVQYFVSRMNPYSPELNYFLAYQYCRSLGLQLVSFETKEKADSITQYLKNAGYNKFDFWTSGNKLGTNMLLWMSTGLPFNVTFNYMRAAGSEPSNEMHYESTIPMMAPEVTGRQADGDMADANGCVTLKSPDHLWEIDDCLKIKDFICEQTRCYYYNYGSIPVSTSQGGNKIISNIQPDKTHGPINNEGHLLNFTATRRVTLRPPLMRKDDSNEIKKQTEHENVMKEQEVEEQKTEREVGVTTEVIQHGEEVTEVREEITEKHTQEDDTYHDAVLGKVSRRKVLDLPTVDRLERKISSSWMNRNHPKV